MPSAEIPTSAFAKIAVGIDRPEDVVVGKDGRVFAADHQCAVAEILPDGSFRRMGPRRGAPNGINMDLQGRVLIANFGIYDREDGPLERFDPATGVRETLVSEVEGLKLTSANYPVMDRAGNIWCANSTHAETWPQALDGRDDGFLFVLRPDGSASVVARGLKFPNGLALSADEKTLYCAQTSGADVLAFPVEGDRLGRGARYGTVLGRLLGIDGVLVDQVDITILDDPLDYLAYDIAAAVRDVEEESAPVQATMLSTLVAELRLCGLIIARIDQFDLVERVMRQLRELQE